MNWNQKNVAELTLEHSTGLNTACERFLSEINDWIRTCQAEYQSIPTSDVHDQATYTTGWAPFIEITQDQNALHFMTILRDQIHQHFNGTGAWAHGYWKQQEVHHGTEHYELFVATLYRLNPKDGDTIAQFVDAAEHIGNWSVDVEPWYDWESGLFRSLWLGTESVRTEPGMDVNMADHFRCANLCLWAYKMTDETRYRELAERAIGLWAKAINESPVLPIGLTKDGPIYELGQEANSHYREFMGQASALITPVDRAENFLASNGVNTFLELWQLTEQTYFLEAAETLLDILATQLDDPDAGPAADVLRSYQRVTGKNRYDQQILAAAEEASSKVKSITTLGIEPFPLRAHRPSGIGKRLDMPNWIEDKQPRRYNPILLATAAEIANDSSLAATAVDLACGYFSLARRVYPNGRHHGCSARSVSAISRGHGRENNAGMVTGVLGPVWSAFLN